MTDRVCDCGACPLCYLHGDAPPARPDCPALSADEVIRASDPHAAPAPAKPRRGKARPPAPGLFDAAQGGDS